MTPTEQDHIISALQFELGKCDDKGVQAKTLEHLNMVCQLRVINSFNAHNAL